MRNYAVLADLRVKTGLHIEKAFDRGYDQGYRDGKAELPTMSTGDIADIKKAEYDRGFDEGYTRAKLITTNDAYEAGYDKGYEKGKQESIEACKKCERTWQDGYSEGYEKGLKHGQELRAAYGEQLWDVVADMQKNP